MTLKTTVYPFDTHFLTFLRANVAFKDKLQITALIAPSGWGFEGKDAGDLDQRGTVGIVITANYEEALNDCDAVLFTEADTDIDKKSKIIPKIESALKAQKQVYCTYPLLPEEVNYFSEKAEKQNCTFSYLNDNLKHQAAIQHLSDDITSAELYKINIPVISAMGIIERLYKYGIQLDCCAWLKKRGYKVAHVGSRLCGKLISSHSIPNFMFSENIASHKKIKLFNHFIKSIELAESPDVIVIGIPGGLLPVNRTFTSTFGITAYKISRAVPPDASIVCMYAEEYTDLYLSELSLLLKYRFSSPNNFYFVDNVKYDFALQSALEDDGVMTIPSELIPENIFNLPYPLFTHQNKKALFEAVEDSLSESANIAQY